MTNALCKKCSWCNADSALLVLRVGVGAIFIYAGWGKVSDLAGTVVFFGTLGFAPFWAYLVSFVELIGGIAVLLGVYTRIAAALLSVVMVVAIYETFPNLQPFENPFGPYLIKGIQAAMTPISILFSTLALKLGGAGRYALLKESCCGSGVSCCVGGVCEECKKDEVGR